jgi:hypothetical protein
VPAQLRGARDGQRRVRHLGRRDRVDDGRLLAGVLKQHEPATADGAVRARLRPVVLDELLGDRTDRHSKRTVSLELAL